MKVWLKRNWFDPLGFRHRSRNSPHEIADDLLYSVPSDSKVEDDKGKVLKDWSDPVPTKPEPKVELKK